MRKWIALSALLTMTAIGATVAMSQGDAKAESQLSSEGDLRSLVGVREYPVRIKCALLPWSALNDALSKLCDRS